jgi:pilus assembly protein Flp/PilA
MTRLKELVRSFITEEDGAAIAEYGLLLGIIAVGLVTILIAFRGEIVRIWSQILEEVQGVEVQGDDAGGGDAGGGTGGGTPP